MYVCSKLEATIILFTISNINFIFFTFFRCMYVAIMYAYQVIYNINILYTTSIFI